MSKVLVKNNLFFEKLYKDLRYRGEMTIVIDSNIFLKIYNPGITTIENEIFWKGINNGWEKISLTIWQKLAINSKIILDIGANTGIYSFIASALNQQAEIYSFEPVKRTANIFKINIGLNPNKNITLIEKAVSNKNGVAIFYDILAESQYSASLNEDMLQGCDDRISYEVDVIALDSFEMFFKKKIDLIKLDVEMHEPEALIGMIKIIKRDMPTILIEILNDELANRIEELIVDFKYLYFSIDEVNPPKHVYKLQKSDYYNYLICTELIARKLNLHFEI